MHITPITIGMATMLNTYYVRYNISFDWPNDYGKREDNSRELKKSYKFSLCKGIIEA